MVVVKDIYLVVLGFNRLSSAGSYRLKVLTVSPPLTQVCQFRFGFIIESKLLKGNGCVQASLHAKRAG